MTCLHADSLWGRCADCGMTWGEQARAMSGCGPTGEATDRWAECQCGTIFTGADVLARREAHILSGEGNVLAPLLGGSSWD